MKSKKIVIYKDAENKTWPIRSCRYFCRVKKIELVPYFNFNYDIKKTLIETEKIVETASSLIFKKKDRDKDHSQELGVDYRRENG